MTTPKYVNGERLRQPKTVTYTYIDRVWGELTGYRQTCPDCGATLSPVSNGTMQAVTGTCPNGHGEFDPYGI